MRNLALLFIVVGLTSNVGCGQGEDLAAVKSALISYGNCGTFNDDQACVCSNANGGGNCAILSLSTRFYANTGTVPGWPYLSDNISSIAMGPLVKGRACYDYGYGSYCVPLTAGTDYNDLSQTKGCNFPPTGGWTDVGWGFTCMQDSITSLRLDPASMNCLNPASNQVAIFADPNYGGDCVVLDRSYPNIYANAYNNPSPITGFTGGGFGLPDNTISSLKCGSAVTLYGYIDPNGGGPYQPVQCSNGSAPTLNSFYDNKISSILIQ